MRPSRVRQLLEREFLAGLRGVHTPVMLWGPPGVGKSQLVSQVAAARSAAMIDIRLAQMEPTDLRGIPFREGGDVVWSTPSLLPRESRDGDRGILFLDEITSAPATVTAAAYQLILDRRLGDYRVPVGWSIVAAGNRLGDRGVTYQMPAPLANRFAHFEVEPDLDDWVVWAHAHEIDPRLVAFLRFRPDLLFSFDPARASAAFPTPRSWEFADRALANYADDPALLADALAGCVGPAAGLALQAFITHLGRLPDLDLILQGRATEAPAALDLQYAVASALIRRVARLPEVGREAAITHVLRYARRLSQREISVMLVADLQRVTGSPLVNNPAFSEWAQEAGGLLSDEHG